MKMLDSGPSYMPAFERHPAILDLYRLPDLDSTYNGGAFVDPESGDGFLLARTAKAAGKGKPDKGPLNLIRVGQDTGGSRLEVKGVNQIWSPPEAGDITRSRVPLYEDARLGINSKGMLVAAVTAVQRRKTGDANEEAFDPYGALIEFSSAKALMTGEVSVRSMAALQYDHQPGPLVVRGKNLTHIEEDTYFFRPEHENYNHKLTVVKIINGRPTLVQSLDVPLTDWTRDRAGTGASPIWIDKENAIFFAHGFVATREVPYHYSVGWGHLRRYPNGTYKIISLDHQPLFAPDTFPGEANELYPGMRRVVYNCGVFETRDSRGDLQSVGVILNRGDTETWVGVIDPRFMIRDIQAYKGR